MTKTPAPALRSGLMIDCLTHISPLIYGIDTYLANMHASWGLYGSTPIGFVTYKEGAALAWYGWWGAHAADSWPRKVGKIAGRPHISQLIYAADIWGIARSIMT